MRTARGSNMENERDELPPKQKARRHQPGPEEIWIKAFLEFSGTDRVTRFYRDGMQGVSLTRAVEALRLGDCLYTEKCDGPGAICRFEHQSDDDAVEVTVFFVAADEVLEIREARVLMEVKGETNDAA